MTFAALPPAKIASWVGVAVLLAGGILYFEHAEKAKIGQPCSQERVGECWGPDQRIACVEGRWAAEPCRGPDGCRLGPKQAGGKAAVLCDRSRNAAGDACLDEGAAFCGTDSSLLRCEQHVLRATRCTGGCRSDGDGQAACSGELR